MLSRLVWAIAAVLIGFWSLLAWGGNKLLSVMLDGSASSVHSVLPPTEMADWVIWSLHKLDDFSGPIVFIVWALVSGLIFGGAWLITRLGRRAQVREPVHPQLTRRW